MKLRLFVLLVAIFLGLASREPPWGDAHVVYETTQSLLDRARLDVHLGGPPQFYAIRDGKKYGVFPLGNVVAMAPSYLAWRALHLLPRRIVPAAVDELLYRFTSHLSPALAMAGACLLLFALARREGASDRAALGLALCAAFATVLLVYARAPFSEALQTLAFTWAIERGLALGDRPTARGGLFAGLALGLLVNTKLVYALVVPIPALYVLARNRKDLAAAGKAIACAAVPFALLVALAAAHNHLKTGSFTDSGYRIPEGVFSGDAYAGLWGYFFSSGKSIFLYSPLLVLAPWAFADSLRRHAGRGVFLLSMMAVVILADAKFRYWHADYCWGPRLLVPLLPAMLLPMATWLPAMLGRGRPRLRALGLGALLGAGLWVQALGCAFYWDHYIRIAIAVKDQTGASGWYGEDLHHCHFIPQFSPLVGHTWMLRHLLHDDPAILADAPWKRVAPGKVNLANEWSGVRLDWWLLDWTPVPAARPAMAAVLLLLASAGAWAALGLRRKLRDAGGSVPAEDAEILG